MQSETGGANLESCLSCLALHVFHLAFFLTASIINLGFFMHLDSGQGTVDVLSMMISGNCFLPCFPVRVSSSSMTILV